MSPRLLVILALAVGALACGRKPSAKPAKKAETAAVPAAAAVPAVETKPDTDWAYSSVGKRDPFRSWVAELEHNRGALQTRCATPLGRFELEQLKLVAVVTGLEDPVAMVQAPTGVGYTIRRGACIGKNGGVIAAVRTGEVVVSEWAIRADGTRDRSQTVLRLPKEAALNLEE